MNQLQTMAVRAITPQGDWTFGAGIAGYLQGNAAIAQQIQTSILQILGECFWDAGAGIAWFQWLQSFDPNGLALAISTVILKIQNVTGINSISINLGANRVFSASWNVSTVFTQTLSGVTTFSVGG
jgi:hypothetical protein